jgi:hypothetical protein
VSSSGRFAGEYREENEGCQGQRRSNEATLYFEEKKVFGSR